jgi:hypothetical protein
VADQWKVKKKQKENRHEAISQCRLNIGRFEHRIRHQWLMWWARQIWTFFREDLIKTNIRTKPPLICTIYCDVSGVPWLIIMGSGLDLLTPSLQLQPMTTTQQSMTS